MLVPVYRGRQISNWRRFRKVSQKGSGFYLKFYHNEAFLWGNANFLLAPKRILQLLEGSFHFPIVHSYASFHCIFSDVRNSELSEWAGLNWVDIPLWFFSLDKPLNHLWFYVEPYNSALSLPVSRNQEPLTFLGTLFKSVQFQEPPGHVTTRRGGVSWSGKC